MVQCGLCQASQALQTSSASGLPISGCASSKAPLLIHSCGSKKGTWPWKTSSVFGSFIGMSAQYNSGHSLFFLIHLCQDLAAFLASAGFKSSWLCFPSSLQVADFSLKVFCMGFLRLRPARCFLENAQSLVGRQCIACVQALQLTCQSLACKVFLLSFELVGWIAFGCFFKLFYPCTAGTGLENPLPHAMVLLMPCYLVFEVECLTGAELGCATECFSVSVFLCLVVGVFLF